MIFSDTRRQKRRKAALKEASRRLASSEKGKNRALRRKSDRVQAKVESRGYLASIIRPAIKFALLPGALKNQSVNF